MEIKNYIGLDGVAPIRFIASDVDGTLVDDAKLINSEVYHAVNVACESNIRVAIASGRAWHEMDDIFHALPDVRYFICTNGAFVMDKVENKELFHTTFDKSLALGLVRRLLTYGVFVEAYVKAEIFGQYPTVNLSVEDMNEAYFRPNIRPFILQTRTMVDNVLAHLEALPEGPEKIQIFFGYDTAKRDAILRDLRDSFQGHTVDGDGRERFYDVLESSEGNLEFVLPHTTKGTAVAALAKHWGYTSDEVMTIGDSENDISMLRFAQYSVAMGNALHSIKSVARYETVDNNHHGVAEAILSAVAHNARVDTF